MHIMLQKIGSVWVAHKLCTYISIAVGIIKNLTVLPLQAGTVSIKTMGRCLNVHFSIIL